MAEVNIQVFGETVIRRRLLRAAENVSDASEAFRRIADLLDGSIAQNFRTQGSSSGVRWADLAPSTIKQKAGSRDPRVRSNARRVLVATGLLRESLSEGGAGHIREITGDHLRWGSRVPYGRFHQKPGGRLPHRPPARLSENMKRNIVRELQRGLFERKAA